MGEGELIRRAQAGDLQAFEQLVRGWREQVFRIARQIVGEEEGAKDVAQLVFIRLWQVLRRYREGGSFAAYLHRITVNLAIDFCREQARSTAESWDPAGMDTLPSPAPGGDASPSLGELQKIFEVVSRRVSPKQRDALVLREIQAIPTEEVSEILGMRQSTIRTHVQEARRILQEALRRHYPEYARGGEDKQR